MRIYGMIPEEQIPAALKDLHFSMKKQPDNKLVVRYQVIYMMLSGESYDRIAECTGLSIATLYNYRKAYLKKGIPGLESKRQPGRQRFLTLEQEEQVVLTILTQIPKDVGFPAQMKWTAILVCEWIKRTFGISFSVRGIRAVMYRLGLTYKQSAYTFKNSSPLF